MKCNIFFSLIILLGLLFSCTDVRKNEMRSLVKSWNGRKIIFPKDVIFTSNGKDMIDYSFQSQYKILTYVDSLGCISCKLKLPQWQEFIDSIENLQVKFLFFFSPLKKADALNAVSISNFTYPICIDEKDSLNKLNHFSSDERFQTFLLDKDNKVVAIGNPVHNPKVKELYLKIIQGEKVEQDKGTEVMKTKINIDKTSISLGRFDWQKEQKVTFTLKNTGNKPLVVQDINTSCGCTSVSYSKEPVQPSGELKLEVTYKAEHPEHFNKTLTVYCNTESSPLILKIMGDAE